MRMTNMACAQSRALRTHGRVSGMPDHLDATPLLTPEQDSVVKLGDFGLAKDGTGQENATTQCGTPDYMAPEVLEGRPYEAAADIFSLGAVLYALLTSRFPKMLALHVSQVPPRLKRPPPRRPRHARTLDPCPCSPPLPFLCLPPAAPPSPPPTPLLHPPPLPPPYTPASA